MRRQRGLVLALLAAVIVAAHSAMLYLVGAHLALSGTVVGGVIIVVLIRHWRLLRR